MIGQQQQQSSSAAVLSWQQHRTCSSRENLVPPAGLCWMPGLSRRKQIIEALLFSALPAAAALTLGIIIIIRGVNAPNKLHHLVVVVVVVVAAAPNKSSLSLSLTLTRR
jgi:hypothetical protein